MMNRWSDADAAAHARSSAGGPDEALASRLYLDELLEAEPTLDFHAARLHSIKIERPDLFGARRRILLVRGSGGPVSAANYAAFDLDALERLRELPDLPEEAAARELPARRLDCHDRQPAPDVLLHAFLKAACVDQTTPGEVLALCCLPEAPRRMHEGLGESVLVLGEAAAGFAASRAAFLLAGERPAVSAMILMHRGLVTWGGSAREAHDALLGALDAVRRVLAAGGRRVWVPAPESEAAAAIGRWGTLAPAVRGALSPPTGDPDRPWRAGILHFLTNPDLLGLLEWDRVSGRLQALALHPEHVDLLGRVPLRLDVPPGADAPALRLLVSEGVGRLAGGQLGAESGAREAAPLPPARIVLMPGLGLAAWGCDARQARLSAEIARRSLAARALAGAAGAPRDNPALTGGRPAPEVLAAAGRNEPLAGRVALVTGAAGAIGAGICEGLLEQGSHVAVSDLPGPRLQSLSAELAARFPERVLGIEMDVTDPGSVREAWAQVGLAWGGIDLVIANAGVAHVAALSEMDLDVFRRAERINTEGTLTVIAEAARQFRLQGTGGDLVLVSTKNVFAPGAGFGAYSATKAAAHQIARVASLELAEFDVRVNMVSPDAVFSHGERRSGLWEEVGPGRMRARGLDAAGLEEYYRKRNLLKARVTARHVARAVLFFATRRTPTTGATIPVDGGLPDSTPR